MVNITVQKITTTEVILADGTIEDYKQFTHTVEQTFMTCPGFAVLIDGKVSKCNRGLWNIFPRKAVAIIQAMYYKNLQS